jgi:hypothetical protein
MPLVAEPSEPGVRPGRTRGAPVVRLRDALGAAITALLLLVGVFYPYFPGQHDATATLLSATAQLVGLLGLPCVPLGLVWTVSHLRARRAGASFRAPRWLGVATLAWGAVLVLFVSLGLLASKAFAAAVLAVVATMLIVQRLRLRLARTTSADEPVPAEALFLIVVPTVVLAGQLAWAQSATRSSRERAIASSAELLQELERYERSYGRYPDTLLAVHKDYSANVVGIDGYAYAPRDDGFCLVFEQPRLLLDDPGIREFVVYEARGRHLLLSHAAWHMAGPPEELELRQGRPTVRETGHPHWKSFLFD